MDYAIYGDRTQAVLRMTLTGILPDGRFVISQLFIEGRVPTTNHLHSRLEHVGWRQYRNAGTVWTSPDGRIVLSESTMEIS